ncbi:MAG TPA: hypothetical protein VJG49_00765 [Candidatus Nanoarchaeia archaeon]|nr:hypothetical protein [Candidatus Nanoarchaeia archaeon]
MTEVKTIKDVDEDTWAEFKGYAARNKVKLGTFFKTLVTNYEKENASFWGKVLKGEKILSDKEAIGMEETSARIRKEPGFRT